MNYTMGVGSWTVTEGHLSPWSWRDHVDMGSSTEIATIK